MIRIALFTLPLLLLPLVQQETPSKPQPVATMVIEGGSNVRDWHADVSDVRTDLVLTGFSGNDLRDLKAGHFRSLVVRIPVRNIDTGNRSFTRNLQKYLLMEEHPEIVYRLQQVDDISMEGEHAVIGSTGSLTAAGRTTTVSMRTHASMNRDGSIQFKGEQPLRMTHFGIEPPTAVMGTIKAHDAVKVKYDLRYTP
jgi:polyisoprenoid-binding protein YceI